MTQQIIAALLLAGLEGSCWHDDELLIRRLHLLAFGFKPNTVEYLTS